MTAAPGCRNKRARAMWRARREGNEAMLEV
jgi:hypothetical protein